MLKLNHKFIIVSICATMLVFVLIGCASNGSSYTCEETETHYEVMRTDVIELCKKHNAQLMEEFDDNEGQEFYVMSKVTLNDEKIGVEFFYDPNSCKEYWSITYESDQLLNENAVKFISEFILKMSNWNTAEGEIERFLNNPEMYLASKPFGENVVESCDIDESNNYEEGGKVYSLHKVNAEHSIDYYKRNNGSCSFYYYGYSRYI